MLGSIFIVVSDEKNAKELLIKRAKMYSDRPAVTSIVNSKSTHGSMEYVPLMGKISKQISIISSSRALLGIQHGP
jgi:hypothetical protein